MPGQSGNGAHGEGGPFVLMTSLVECLWEIGQKAKISHGLEHSRRSKVQVLKEERFRDW